MAVTADSLAAEDAAFAKQAAARQEQEHPSSDILPSSVFHWMSNGPVGRATLSALDSAVSAADSMYDSEPMRKARDAATGAVTGATNIAETGVDAFNAASKNVLGPTAGELIKGFTGRIWDHAKEQILGFRDAAAVQDPTLADNLTQGVAQLALPFAGYSRMLGGLEGLSGAITSGALTDATALGPHDARLADLIALGRHTEGKLGEVLRTLVPDGSAFNAYISYLADRGDESEAEGRFKNVLDGFGANLIATPLIHAAGMVLKQGTSAIRNMVDQGVSSALDLIPKSPARPPLHQGADPAESILEDQVRRDADAARAPGAKRPPLRQGADPAESIYDDQVRRDVDNSRAGSSTAARFVSYPTNDSPLNAVPALTSFRKVLQSQAGTLGDLVTPGTARPVKVSAIASTLVQHIPDDGAEGSFYKDVLQRVAERNPDSNLRVSSEDHPDMRVGEYQLILNKTHLFPGAFRNNAQLVHTFAHEAVHATVFRDIESSPITRNLLDDLRKQVAAPIDEHNNAVLSARRAGATGSGQLKAEHYGTTNVQEFVAEAESNPEFRKVLQNTPAKDGRSVWDNYKDTIAGILGIGGAVAASPLFDKLLTKEEPSA